jgi:TonB family protein
MRRISIATTLILTVLVMCWVPRLAHAVLTPVMRICENARGRQVVCPPEKPTPAPKVSAAARRQLLKSMAADLKDKQVVNRYNLGFLVLTPALWTADRLGATEGWCVASTHDTRRDERRFYHLRVDEKTCLAVRNDASQSPRFEPFDAYKQHRIVCDSPDSKRCEQAATRVAALARLDLATAPNVVFEDPDMAASLRQRAAGWMTAQLRQPNPTLLVDRAYFPGAAERSSCVGIEPGGTICGNAESGQILIFAQVPKSLIVSASQPLPSGFWRYRVVENAYSRRCIVMDAHEVQTFTVFVENASNETLSCTASINTGMGEETPQRIVVDPREGRAIFEACTADAKLVTAQAECTVGDPVAAPAWNVPAGCSYSVTRAPALDDYYPAASKRLGEEGSVDVSFVLPEGDARLRDVELQRTSGTVRLDEAAVRYVRSMRASTTCPGTRNYMRIRFRLNDFGVAEEPISVR